MKPCAINMDYVNYRLIITCDTLYLLTAKQHAIYNLTWNYSYYKYRFQLSLFRFSVKPLLTPIYYVVTCLLGKHQGRWQDTLILFLTVNHLPR